MTQTVKNLPAIQETQGQPLGWEDPLEKGMPTHSNILVWGCVKGLDDLPTLEAKSNLIGAKTVPLPHSTCWELLRNFADSIVSILWSK